MLYSIDLKTYESNQLNKEELKELKNKFKEDKRYLENKDYLDIKLEFLFSNYDIERTLITYWGTFKNKILEIEKGFNKDLYEFNVDEAKQMLLSIPAPRNVKYGIFTLASLYVDWALKIEKLRIGTNPFAEMDIDEVLVVNKKVIQSEYISLDEIFEMAKVANNSEGLAQRIITVLLARMGVYGKEGSFLSELRQDDIDRENNIIRIVDHETGELLTEIPVLDERLYYWLNMAIDENSYDCKPKTKKKDNSDRIPREIVLYEYDNRVLKSFKRDKEIADQGVLYKAPVEFFELNGVKPLSFKKLVRSAKFDMLNKILEEKKEINTDDFKAVYGIFEPFSKKSAYFSLKKDYIIFNPEAKIVR